jgi:hypothetical protein
MLAPLILQRDAACAGLPDLRQRVLFFVDLALGAERGIDRSFWLHAAAEEITVHAGGDSANLINVIARRIHATHRVTYRERCEAVRVIVGKVSPLA